MSKKKEVKKKSFIERVLDRINGGEEGKITRFQKYVVKALENSLKVTDDEIETLNDSLEDFEDQRMEALDNVDPEKVSTIEDVKNYIPVYIEKQNAIFKKKKFTEDEIEKLELKAELYESMLKDLS